MVIVQILMAPKGDRANAYLMAEGTIANISQGAMRSADALVGDYDVRLMKAVRFQKPGQPVPVWKRGRVMGFPRKRLGEWDLLLRALCACLFKRNPEEVSRADYHEFGPAQTDGQPTGEMP